MQDSDWEMETPEWDIGNDAVDPSRQARSMGHTETAIGDDVKRTIIWAESQVASPVVAYSLSLRDVLNDSSVPVFTVA